MVSAPKRSNQAAMVSVTSTDFLSASYTPSSSLQVAGSANVAAVVTGEEWRAVDGHDRVCWTREGVWSNESDLPAGYKSEASSR